MKSIVIVVLVVLGIVVTAFTPRVVFFSRTCQQRSFLNRLQPPPLSTSSDNDSSSNPDDAPSPSPSKQKTRAAKKNTSAAKETKPTKAKKTRTKKTTTTESKDGTPQPKKTKRTKKTTSKQTTTTTIPDADVQVIFGSDKPTPILKGSSAPRDTPPTVAIKDSQPTPIITDAPPVRATSLVEDTIPKQTGATTTADANDDNNNNEAPTPAAPQPKKTKQKKRPSKATKTAAQTKGVVNVGSDDDTSTPKDSGVNTPPSSAPEGRTTTITTTPAVELSDIQRDQTLPPETAKVDSPPPVVETEKESSTTTTTTSAVEMSHTQLDQTSPPETAKVDAPPPVVETVKESSTTTITPAVEMSDNQLDQKTPPETAKVDAPPAVAETAKESSTPIDEEAALAAKLSEIQDLGDRAYAVLMNLGMISSSPDPNSPDYDPSMDDEIAEGTIFKE